MKQRFAWLVLAILLACTLYGLIHERLFSQDIWLPEGIVRFLGYTAVYWIAAGMMRRFRPQWFLPAVAGFVFLYSTVWCWEFFNPLAPLVVLYFLGSCFFLGRLIARTGALTTLLIGLAVWIFVLSISVHFPVNRPLTYSIAFALPYLANLRRPLPQIPSKWPQPLMLVYVLLAQWLVVLKPEVSSDGLAMHLAIPTMIFRDRLFNFDFQQYTWALMPSAGDLAYTAVYLPGGEAASRLLNFALLAIIAAMVYRASRRWLSPAGASVAAALFASTPMVQLVTGSLFVENVWAVFILGASLALFDGEVVWAALLFGAALSTKVGTSAFLAPAVVLAVQAIRKMDRHRWRTALLAVTLLAVFGAPPYVNAWVKSHNPVFPFENKVFKSPYFAADNSLQDVRYRKASDWKTPYDATFHSTRYYEGRNGGVGFQYFLLLPALLLLLDRRSPWALVALGLTGAVVSFLTLPNVRYLYPALPLFSIGIAWMMAELPGLTIAAGALLALNLWFLPASGWYHAEFALFTPTQMAEYKQRSAPQRELVARLNLGAPGEPVAFLHGGVLAGLDAKGYSDTWHTYTFWKRMISAEKTPQIAALFREYGIHHLVSPVPVNSEFPIVEKFVNEWTAPEGVAVGRYELRSLLTTPHLKPRDTSPAKPGSYEDTDERIVYTGAWLYDPQFKAASGGSITYSNAPGDALRFFFEGSAITYVYTTAVNRGTAEVRIDGRLKKRVNEYSADTQWQQQTIFKGLAPGPHAIEIRVLPKKDKESSGYFVDLDRFVVNP